MKALCGKFHLQTPAQLLSVFLIPLLIFGSVACNTSWVNEAIQIVGVLAPAASGILGLVLPFAGAAIPAADVVLIQGIINGAGPALAGVKSLLDQYKSALPADKPAILDKINAGLATLQKNLGSILSQIHIKDAALLAKVEAVVGAVVGEIQQLEALLPIVQGKTTAARVNFKPLSARQFKSAFNAQMKAPSGNPQLDQVANGLILQ